MNSAFFGTLFAQNVAFSSLKGEEIIMQNCPEQVDFGITDYYFYYFFYFKKKPFKVVIEYQIENKKVNKIK